MTYWVRCQNPDSETGFATIRSASVAFGKMLNRAEQVSLIEETLLGDVVLAEKARPEVPRRAPHCPACGRRHTPDQHGGDPTAVRLLMAHHDGNHGQCHPLATCKDTTEGDTL